MNYIKRNIEDQVRLGARDFKAVLVTGARQTGKSTLLRHAFPDRKVVTFDDPFLEAQANENPNMFMALNPPPVTFDEVQHVPGLFRYIKMECDSRDSYGCYCLSGSQPFRLMQSVSESLSGRVSIIELAPLSLREITGDDFNHPFLPTMEHIMARQTSVVKPENIWQIIHRGGYPELYQNPELDWQQFFASYVKTYLERDVRELSAVQDLDAFRRFMIAAAARTGQMVNYANIADEVGKDAGTIRNWISILEASGIIYLLEPYTPAVLKRAIKTPKLYFRDTGLACYLTRWLTPDTLALGAMAGSIFETFVVSEILKSYSNSGVDYRYCVSYYRGKDKLKRKTDGRTVETEAEIDLIIEENGVLHPVEIKKNTHETASATAAFQILDRIEDKNRGQGAVISLHPEPGLLRDNVLEIPAWYI